MSFENLYSYTAVQFEVVLSVFTLTAAVFAAVLVYSLATAGSIAPRYRLTSYLTGVVMVSATLELGLLALRWNNAFTWNGSGVRADRRSVLQRLPVHELEHRRARCCSRSCSSWPESPAWPSGGGGQHSSSPAWR